MKICIIIPVYNSENLIESVIKDCLKTNYPVFVVNDGSTDNTYSVIQQFDNQINIISYHKNRGKGYALKTGFLEAIKQNYDYAITIDADGQHRPSDVPLFVEKIVQFPDALVLGCRDFNNPNMPDQNKFANNFSNFWFRVQTLRKLPDTQTGYRSYPLKALKKFCPITNRYETELEMLVKTAWRGIKIVTVFINVYYPPQTERLSHFNPKKDFIRISLLNTALCLIALLYGYPSMLIHKIYSK
jgi:glycosyltransferase involved in cell wall biosynthesis